MAAEEHLKILNRGSKVWNSWRRDNPHTNPDLSKADLTGLDMPNANFSGVNFRGAILVKANFITLREDAEVRHLARLMDSYVAFLDRADLSDADLRYSNLANVDLSQANLSRANLSFADLSNSRLDGAELAEAKLLYTNLSGAYLKGANFSNATLGHSIIGDVGFSEAAGLDTVKHRGPSDIGINTIFKSKGCIPEVFLRGCGIPENFITHMHDLVIGAQPIEFYSCFISYSHADKSFARRLHDALQGRGIRCWLDEHQVLPGQKIYTEVDRGIRLWDKVLLCCSKDSLRSWWVENEIQIAFDKEQQLRRQRDGEEVLALIPLNLDGYLLSDEWKSGLRTEIRSRLAADFTGWGTDNAKFEAAFERLVRALRADAGGRELPPPSRL